MNILIRNAQKTDTLERKEDQMTMKLETGTMWAQVKELSEPPEAGKSDEGSSPSAFRDSIPANPLTLDFWSPEL